MASGDELFSIDATVDANGVPVTAYIVKRGLDLGEPNYIKLVKRIWPRIRGVNGSVIQVRVGSSATPDGGVAWGPYIDYTIGQQQKIDTFTSGRYIAVTFSSQILPSWQLSGFDIEYSLGGRE